MAPPTGVIPPPLPPSVEEAYRRKCVQLKQRMIEVEEANDASRVRLVRMQRGIEKMRLERAFLLEQLAKRTSTNVEDSEGSPSPPPTPKEKPLRTKRGHRKPSFLNTLGDSRASSAFVQQGPVTLSPSSDAFSHTHPESNLPYQAAQSSKRPLPSSTNGHSVPVSTPPRKPRNAFDLYCNDTRSVMMVQNRQAMAEGTFDIERALAIGWRDLAPEAAEEFHRRFELEKRKWESVEKEVGIGGGGARQSIFDGEGNGANGDEDIEMKDEVEVGGGGGGGFTAVNRE
ncbi:hypothetical protein B7494_g3305 [Chlorociboria aeruginascens]|nr:hypothetical protein B7494_g3305 [Chlorociboria aeruginascens]